MDASEIRHKRNAGVAWAVVGRGPKASREQKTTGNVPKAWCTKVVLVDNLRYVRTFSVLSFNDRHRFIEAPAQERRNGFLVTDGAGYWVCPSTDFVDSWEKLDAGWTEEKRLADAKEVKRLERSDAEELVKSTLRLDTESLVENLKRSTMALLGSSVYLTINVTPQVTWVEDTPTGKISGTVMLRSEDYQRLLEKLYEAQEANN